MAAALLVEFRTTMDRWLTVPAVPADVYRWLAVQPRSVVAEVPFARADELHLIHDGLYMFNSTWHWQPIVNGYSGFFPKSFIDLAEETASFPDDQSIAYLKTREGRFHRDSRQFDDAGGVWGDDRNASCPPRIETVARHLPQRMGSDVVLRLRR